jgi:hypothetical protein
VGFAHDTNAVTLLRPGQLPREVEIADKQAIARAVIDEIVSIRNAPVATELTPTTLREGDQT